MTSRNSRASRLAPFRTLLTVVRASEMISRLGLRSPPVNLAIAAISISRHFVRSNQTDTIAVAVPNIENAFFAEIVAILEHLGVADRRARTVSDNWRRRRTRASPNLQPHSPPN